MRFLPLAALAGAALLTYAAPALAQDKMPEDKSKRPSPPAVVKTSATERVSRSATGERDERAGASGVGGAVA